MKRNMGNLDRILRVIVGLVLIAYAIPLGFSATGWNWVGWLGVPLLLTAAISNCPAYSILGISSGSCCNGGSCCKKEGDKA